MKKERITNLLNSIYNKRYFISLIIFAILVVFEVNGSSIGCWKDYSSNNVDNGVIVGTSRSVRVDEWGTFTPMTFSQKYNNYRVISSLLRASKTNVFMVYALPVKSIFQIYRPFQIGYLFLGNAKGLSFFWYGRLIALMLVSIEFFMILTNQNKKLSIIGSILISLSPIIQWWFSINGIAELFIFGELAIVSLYKYMNNNNFKWRCLYLFLMIISAGGYILVFYPAWQIPLFYVFLVIAISVIVLNKNKCKISKKDIISIIIALLIFISSIGYILYSSIDVIKTVMNTAYPGKRVDLGGGNIKSFVTYIGDLFYPFFVAPAGSNQSESSLMFGLFPIGIIISIRYFIKNKKSDIFLMLFLSLYLFLSIWCIFGFSEIFAKISLLYLSPSGRTFIAIGFLDVLILIRCLSLEKNKYSVFVQIIISSLISVIIVISLHYIDYNFFYNRRLILCLAILFILFYLILDYNRKYNKVILSIIIIFIMLESGLTVNPIRIGTGVIDNSKILNKVKKINKESSGTWVVENVDYPATNYLLFSGVKTLNSTQTYPDILKWHKIDEKNEYSHIYNRYAHVKIKLYESNNEYVEKFKLKSLDYMEVSLVKKDLKKLKIKYIFTERDLSKFDEFLDKVFEDDRYKIYRVV